MKTDKATIWIQIVTGLSVIAGLGLVIWELQQVKTLTRAQLTSEVFAIVSSQRDAVLGDNAAEALAKSCSHPADLSLSEAELLVQYFESQMSLANRIQILTDRDGVYPQGYWQAAVRNYFAGIFRSPFGVAWFLRQRAEWWNEELLATGREILGEVQSPWCETEGRQLIEAATRLKDSISPPPFDSVEEEMTRNLDQHIEQRNGAP